jgi:predicted Zn-dependent peptidase
MTSMAECLLFHGRWIPIDDYYRRLEAVTPDAIHTLAKSLFKPGNLTLALVGPVPNPDTAARWLFP